MGLPACLPLRSYGMHPADEHVLCTLLVGMAEQQQILSPTAVWVTSAADSIPLIPAARLDTAANATTQIAVILHLLDKPSRMCPLASCQ